MFHTDELRSLFRKAEETAEQIVQHLLRSPCDLADTRYLMYLFQASTAEF